MGFLNNDHIKRFVAGQTIVELADDADAPGCFRLRFSNGESLRIALHKRGCKCCEVDIIATPYDANSEVKQSTIIMATEGIEK